ncbi:hypothetical protein CYY_005751 [Polysphondylium violaceum]|uniref:Uncharacterized protein n=1 Tax=Polysphondylium violaceum TaxID=133409 RepID=A0A8J4V6K0_9MYCE|nr:hypothetical protein CYY_005751 [Polysphondylium violaceum]
MRGSAGKSNKIIGFALFGVISAAFIYPYIYINKKLEKPPVEKYVAGSNLRGGFVNSGSRDMGKDNTKYNNNYAEHKRNMELKHAIADQKASENQQ